MVRRGHVPLRTCVGCGQRSARHDLVRVCVDEREHGAEFTVDRSGKAGGRGAWLCASAECLDRAMQRDQLRRRLRTTAGTGSLRQEFIDHLNRLKKKDG